MCIQTCPTGFYFFSQCAIQCATFYQLFYAKCRDSRGIEFSLIIIYQCEKLGKNVNLTDILIAFSKSKAGVRLKIYLRKLSFSFILNPHSAQCECEILCRYVQRVIIMTEAKRASNSIVEPRTLTANISLAGRCFGRLQKLLILVHQ